MVKLGRRGMASEMSDRIWRLIPFPFLLPSRPWRMHHHRSGPSRRWQGLKYDGSCDSSRRSAVRSPSFNQPLLSPLSSFPFPRAKDREDRAQTYVDICASFPSRPVFALFILARDLLGLTLLFSLTVPCQFVDFSRSPPTEPRPRRSDLTYRHPFLSLSLLHIILSPAA
jgi:hypothetical protein